jgi:hypothetical protein
MFLTPKIRSGVSTRWGLTALAAVVLLSARPAVAGTPPGPQIPPDARGFQRTMIQQEWLRRQPTSRRPVAEATHQEWYIPRGAPLRGSYTWYAPPKGYKVIREGTPSAPRYQTVIGPDGTRRTFRLEGPVVTRLRYVAVRDGTR